MNIYQKIKMLRETKGMSQQTLAEKVGFKTASAVNKIELGLRDINQAKIIAFAKALDTTPSYLMGWEDDINPQDYIKFPEPTIATDIVRLPIIGSIAAGYDELAVEDWSGDTVEIPTEYLHGRPKSDFFVLQVDGNSMYPLYMDGDRVVIRKTPTLDRSGQIGAIIYDNECATLKKVEYVMGEDWMKLIPINPEYPPKMIEGVDLEQCRVIGVPVLLIRDVEE